MTPTPHGPSSPDGPRPLSAASTSAEPLLAVRELTVAYVGAPVVHDVTFSLAAGRTLAVIGESGSGKSTIARAVLRLLHRTRAAVAGSIRVRGQETTSLSERRFLPLRGRVLGFVPQDPGSSLNPVRTIGSQALEAAALVPGASSGAERRQLVLAAFERVGLPDPERLFDAHPHQLSGGQLQRVLIALAILPRPAVVIADEPTSALDVTVQKQILDLLDELRSDLGIGILLITHDLALAAERSDQVIVLRAGRIQDAGPTAEVFAAPSSAYTRELQADVPGLHPERFAALRAAREEVQAAPGGAAQDGTVHDGAEPDGAEPDGAVQKDAVQKGAVQKDAVQVRFRGVSRTFRTRDREVRALDEVSFSIPRGRTHALVGESGSGKSTAARVLLGLERADAGELRVGGEPVHVDRPKELRALRRDLQIVYQNPFTSLDPRFTVERIVREPLDLYRVGTAGERAERVAWALESVRLPVSARARRASALSGGQRQRVAIARALVLRPEVLVLDEPTSALDVTVQAGILEVLATLQRDLGLTYLFISHDLGVVRQFADTLTVLRRGEVVEEGEVPAVFAAPAAEYTRHLIASIPARSESGRRAEPVGVPA